MARVALQSEIGDLLTEYFGGYVGPSVVDLAALDGTLCLIDELDPPILMSASVVLMEAPRLLM